MSSNAYALPWPSNNVLKVCDGSSSNAHEDSAFHEYSNPTTSSNSFDSAGDNSCLSSPCPDYEEVPHHQRPQEVPIRGPCIPKRSPVRLIDNNEVAYVYNLASAAEESTKRSSSIEGITSILGASVLDNKADKEKIMTSKVFCIHKVRISAPSTREICLAPFE